MDYSLKAKMEELGLYELGIRTTFDKIDHEANNASRRNESSDKAPISLLGTKIAGTSFIEDRSVFDDIQIGESLFLSREPMNQHDPMAIAIYTSSGKKVGYVPKDDNTVIGNMIDAGKHIGALILDIVDHNRYSDISIEIYMEEV